MGLLSKVAAAALGLVMAGTVMALCANKIKYRSDGLQHNTPTTAMARNSVAKSLTLAVRVGWSTLLRVPSLG